MTVPPLLDWAHAATERLDVELIVIGDSADVGGHRTLHDLTTTGAELAAVPVDPATTAFLLASRCTSGPPKLVMLTHQAYVATSHAVAVATSLEPGDCTLLVLPLFHAGGLTAAFASLVHGVKLVLQPGFELPRFLQAVADHGTTLTFVVPPIAQALARHPLVDDDLSSLRLVLSTAASLSAGLERALSTGLGCAVGQGYGMTEGLPLTISRSDAPGYRSGSVGAAAPSTELRLVDPDADADASPGHPGELWVRGPQLMTGYAGDPAATAATLTTDGWLRTGDLCSIDAHGAVTVNDRLKELIKVNEMQVPRPSWKASSSTIPTSGTARWCPARTTGPAKCRSPTSWQTRSTAAVKAYVADQVPSYKRLADVVVVDELPRTPTGKLLRRTLAERERRPTGRPA